jgi:hypothetical protein
MSQRIKPKAAAKLVDEVIQCGYWQSTPLVTPGLLQRRGADYEAIVSAARNVLKPVFNFENVCGPTWRATPGVKVLCERSDGTAEVLAGVDDPGGGVITTSVYRAKFRAACELLVNAAGSPDVFEALMSAITKGLTSIDSFLVEIATEWNRRHSGNRPLDIGERINAEDRIDRWLLAIAGARFDKSTRNWNDYKKLVKARNEWDQHAIHTGRAISLKELVEVGNLFATGIAGLLFDLHLRASRKVPVDIIRLKYFSGFYAS